MPTMPVVAVVIDVAVRDLALGGCHGDAGERDCRKRGDEFDLVHGVVPFFVCVFLFFVTWQRLSALRRALL